MRANTVCNYLLSRGIPKQNVRITGYGETRPIASNGTEEGRKLNRRTECLIFDVDALPKEQLEHMSHMDTTGIDEYIVDEVIPKKKIGDTLHPKVHFLYNNGAFLTSFSKEQLDRVYVALKSRPKMKLQIVGFIDKVGSEYNNKILYEKRVNTVLNYLLEKGVTPDRFTEKSFQHNPSPKIADLTMGNSEMRKVQFVLAEY
jgi:outer membrane protein OmpA-like peptidoglycan-associated protein